MLDEIPTPVVLWLLIPVCLAGGLLGLFAGHWAGKESTKARAVENGAAWYDQRTGEFRWKDGKP